jgi:ABC-type dipeptide/oligopeptide/nickel transport system ATPase component
VPGSPDDGRQSGSAQRAALEAALASYVDPQVVRHILSGGKVPLPSGVRRVVTCLFADVRGFTRFAESCDPVHVVSLLDSFFASACRIALDHGGTIDKLVGDAVMVLFGVPESGSGVPRQALRAAIAMVGPDEKVREVLRLLELTDLAERLDETDHWEKRLSGGEQQRLAFARVLLHEPTWVFLDDATAALDEETERRAYAVLTGRLPDATVVSIAHRPAVAQYHTRRWTIVPRGDGRSELHAA